MPSVMRYLTQSLTLSVEVNLFSSVALACSGPGARALVDGNTRLSLQLFAVGCFLAAATAFLYFLRRKRASLIIATIAALLIAVHPVWTISAMVGDCGASKASASMSATGILGILFVTQLALWLFPFVFRRRA